MANYPTTRSVGFCRAKKITQFRLSDFCRGTLLLDERVSRQFAEGPGGVRDWRRHWDRAAHGGAVRGAWREGRAERSPAGEARRSGGGDSRGGRRGGDG